VGSIVAIIKEQMDGMGNFWCFAQFVRLFMNLKLIGNLEIPLEKAVM
jgi:hypothetical protein